jgi:hypothetical protein
MVNDEEIRRFLLNCRELALFCSQNGWIDDDSIAYELMVEGRGEVRIAVGFDEIIMKGAGCEGRRLPRHGELRLEVGNDGCVTNGSPI